MIDVAIIGGGPAGLSAAINVAARNKKAIVFARKIETSALWKAEKINNHLGMSNMTGASMMKSFAEHAKELKIEIREGMVLQIMPIGTHFMISFGTEVIEAKTVILALGIAKGSSVRGEAEYLGKGVSYCATCDGMLYKGKDVIVIAEIEEGADDANFLMDICNKVYYVNMSGKTPKLNENIKVLDGKISKVLGNEFVTGIEINEEIIPVEAAFFIKESMPLKSIIHGVETDYEAIVVGKQMETNIKGVYACGDVAGHPYQLSKAIGEGQIAGQAAVSYIVSMERK